MNSQFFFYLMIFFWRPVFKTSKKNVEYHSMMPWLYFYVAFNVFFNSSNIFFIAFIFLSKLSIFFFAFGSHSQSDFSFTNEMIDENAKLYGFYSLLSSFMKWTRLFSLDSAHVVCVEFRCIDTFHFEFWMKMKWCEILKLDCINHFSTNEIDIQFSLSRSMKSIIHLQNLHNEKWRYEFN